MKICKKCAGKHCADHWSKCLDCGEPFPDSSQSTGWVSGDETDLLMQETIKECRPLSEIDLVAFEKETKRVCAKIDAKRKKPNS